MKRNQNRTLNDDKEEAMPNLGESVLVVHSAKIKFLWQELVASLAKEGCR